MTYKKKYKKYCNENYLRFNLDDNQALQHFIKEFGEERTEKLKQLFNERDNRNSYNFCENFKESSCLIL